MRNSLKEMGLAVRGAVLRALRPKRPAGGAAPARRDEVTSILFVRIDGIGDLVLSTPAMDALKTVYPGAEITVLVSPAARDLLLHHPSVSRIVVYDRNAPIRKKLDVIRTLRRFRFDVAVDPFDSWDLEPALLAGLSAAPVRVGYASGGGRDVFFTAHLPAPARDRHITEVVAGLLAALGAHPVRGEPRLHVSQQECGEAARFIESENLGGRALIGVHPGASSESQHWPEEYYAELIDAVTADGGRAAIVFGGPGDGERLKRIGAAIRGRRPVFVQGDLRRFCALVRRCRVLVCNNSGPLHVAAALGVATVSFMGPTVQQRWHPLGSGHVVLRLDDLPCIGCNAGVCKTGTLDCMRRITPGMAVRAVFAAAGF
ncbi:MAG: glycosyltransferase family 9 protein [Syntrophaceae bacterium]|nr:glycosyltransferase family 9 protein [Syntrophaceae bacterium]